MAGWRAAARGMESAEATAGFEPVASPGRPPPAAFPRYRALSGLAAWLPFPAAGKRIWATDRANHPHWRPTSPFAQPARRAHLRISRGGLSSMYGVRAHTYINTRTLLLHIYNPRVLELCVEACWLFLLARVLSSPSFRFIDQRRSSRRHACLSGRRAR